MGRRGARARAQARHANILERGVQLLPLVPRHGARLVRESPDRRIHERQLCQHKGGQGRAARHRRHIPARLPDGHRPGRLAAERLSHPRPGALPRRHVLPLVGLLRPAWLRQRAAPDGAGVEGGQARRARRGRQDGLGPRARAAVPLAGLRVGPRRGRGEPDADGRSGQRRVRLGAQVPQLGVRLVPARLPAGRPVLRVRRQDARPHGARRHIRPRGRRLPQVFDRRALARAAL